MNNINSHENPQSKNSNKQKKESELKSEFLKYLNEHCKLSNEEDNMVSELNQIIMQSCLKGKKDSSDSYSLKTKIVLDEQSGTEQEKSDMIQNLETAIKEVQSTKKFLLDTKSEIENSFSKLNLIIESRDELSTTLKDFNNSSKKIMVEKEKILKLKQAIDKISKVYEDTTSIQAFFENTKDECVEKMRFTSDYDDIENGINFFQINTDYVEAENYLNTYIMLKRIALNRYYNYMSNSLQVFFNLLDGITLKDDFFNFLLDCIPKNMNKKFYNVPKNFEKMKTSLQFFELKTKYDYEVKKTTEDIKKKFVDQRSGMLKPFYEEILSEIGKAYKKPPLNDEEKLQVNIAIGDISKLIICEMFFFSILFQTSIQDNIYVLQKITSDLYENFYNHLRPIIVSIDSLHLEELFILFDSLSENFSLFFTELNDQEVNNTEEVNNKIFTFFKSLQKSHTDSNSLTEGNSDLTTLIMSNIHKIKEIIKISKNLIRPTILKLVQDIQEKIYFAVHLLIKNNLNEFDESSALSSYKEKVSLNHPHFSLFHYFLRKMAILFDLLRNKLDPKVLNELAAIAIEKFISNLNEEILYKKNLTYEFEIYIIQQILLGIKITEEFEVEAVESGVEIDFYSITDIFKNNFSNFFSNFTFKDVIFNSAIKVQDKTRDYKKILYNNLLKSYKIFINLINEFMFSRVLMELVYKMRKNEKLEENIVKEKILQRKEVVFAIRDNFLKIIQELNNQIKLIDVKIAEKLASTIIENINIILAQFRKAVGNNEESTNILKILDIDCDENSLEKIKESVFKK